MKVRDVIQMLERDGWSIARTRGSHRQYKHPTKPGLVTIPGKPSNDLAVGTLGSVFKREMTEAIEFHLEGMREEGYEIPTPRAYSTYVDIPA